MKRFQAYLLTFCFMDILGMNGEITKPTMRALDNDPTILSVLENNFENTSLGIMTVMNGSSGNLTTEDATGVSLNNNGVLNLGGIIVVQGLDLTLGSTALGVNTLLLVTLLRFDVLHSPGNVIAGALAIADACHGVSRILVVVTDRPYGLQLPGLCYLQTALGLTAQLGNIGLILVMTIHRLITIKYPLRYDDLVTTRRTFKAIALCWALILTMVSMLTILDWNSEDPQLEPGSGYRCWSYRYMDKPMFTALTHPLYFAGLIISGLICAWIKVIVPGHEKCIKDSNCQNAQAMLPPMGRANKTIIKVLVLYALTTMPAIVLDMCVPYLESAYTGTHLAVTVKDTLRYVFSSLWISKSYLNAVVYSISNEMFREKMKATLLCRET